MSDDVLANIEEQESNTKELLKKESELHRDGVETRYDDMKRRKEDLRKTQNISLGNLDDSYFAERISNTKSYLRDAKNSKVFLTPSFRGKVPYYRKNILLLGGLSGDGKSTTCANIAYGAIRQNQRALVISNEEAAEDVYNRVTCLVRGWSYTDHENFTEQQIEAFGAAINILKERLVVIDDSYLGGIGQTTTIEGIEATLDSVLKNNDNFDVIIIDYYQNVDRSNKNPSMSNWQVQERFASYLDKFKNHFDGPIVVLAQLKPVSSENTSFKDRIEGRKVIYNKCTCAIEIKAEREKLRTSWTIIKSRWTQYVNDSIRTGYEKGKYVEYTTEFAQRIDALRMSQEKQDLKGLSKIKPTGY